MDRAAKLALVDQWKSECESGVDDAVAELKQQLIEGVDPAVLWWNLYWSYFDERTGNVDVDMRALCLTAATLTMKLAQSGPAEMGDDG